MLRRLRQAALCGLFAVAPSLGAAHPHVFVDTGLRLVVDEAGLVTGIEVSWAYDALYSMLTFEDMGLDRDYDGQLTAGELRHLDGFDLKWIEGFEGDVYLETVAGPVALGRPEGRGVAVEEARIVSLHYRPLAQPVAAHGLVLRAYDPTFYTAYDLVRGVDVGAECAADVTPADLDAAYTLVEELLYAIPASAVEEAFPEVGKAFADTVVIRCTG